MIRILSYEGGDVEAPYAGSGVLHLTLIQALNMINPNPNHTSEKYFITSALLSLPFLWVSYFFH